MYLLTNNCSSVCMVISDATWLSLGWITEWRCVNKPRGTVKVSNALQTRCSLLKTTPPCAYKAWICQFSLETQTNSCVSCLLSLSSCNRHLVTLLAHYSVHLFIEFLFGSNHWTLIQSEFQGSRQFTVLIKSSLNMQNRQDTFYKEVTPGRSHYPLLISLIKSTAVTRRRHR